MRLALPSTLAGVIILFAACHTIEHAHDSAVPGHSPLNAQRPSYAYHQGPRANEPWIDLAISMPERQIIQGYVAAHTIQEQYPGKWKKPKSLPPGLAKKVARGGELPPGWQKKFAAGEVMPPEVYYRSHHLPRDLVVKLPPQPSGTILIAVEGKVVRLIQATREILDVFEVGY